MDVLNKKDRSKALILFITFFVFTLFIALTAVFFNAYFPFKENTLLKEENKKLTREFQFFNDFSFQLESVKQTTDSINMPGTNNFFNEHLALSRLADMYKEIPKNDTIQNHTLYNNIILAYKEIIDLKKQIRLEGTNLGAMDSLEAENARLIQDVSELRTDLLICKKVNRNS